MYEKYRPIPTKKNTNSITTLDFVVFLFIFFIGLSLSRPFSGKRAYDIYFLTGS